MDINILKKAMCTDEEKKDLIKIIDSLESIAEVCVAEGFLALMDIKDIPDNNFLKISINLILGGFETEMIRATLENLLLVDESENKCLLEKVLIFEGMILIHQHYSGEVVKTILLSMLGEKWLCQYIDTDLYDSSRKSDVSAAELYDMKAVLDKIDMSEEKRLLYSLDQWAATKVPPPRNISEEEVFLYFAMLNSLKIILKSHTFFNNLAAIYWIGESQNNDAVKISKLAEEVVKIIDDHLTSKLIEFQEKIVSFCKYRNKVFDKLFNVMSNSRYINYDENARFAFERAISLTGVDLELENSKISNLERYFPERVNEFLKIVMVILFKNYRVSDFKVFNNAIYQTIIQGKKAENIMEEFATLR